MDIQQRNLPSTLSISLRGSILDIAETHRHLGVVILSELRWKNHVEPAISRVSGLLGLLKRLRSRNSQSRSARYTFCRMYIWPSVESATIVWSGGLPQYLTSKLERLQ